MTVTSDDPRDDPDDIRDPLSEWGRTARLVVIRLSEAAAAALPVLAWWVMRR